MRLPKLLLPAMAGISLLAAGCEPASITEARDQLGRGTARSVTYQLPVARDTFYIDSLLGDDTTRTADGRRAISTPDEVVEVAVGEKLKFDAVTLDTLRVDIPDASLSPPAGTVNFGPVTYSAFALEPRIQAIDTVVAEGGTLTITTRNKLERTTVSYNLTLNGFKNASGVTLSGSGSVGPGDGTNYTSHTLAFNLAGVTIVPNDVQISVSGSVTWAGGGIPAGQGNDAVMQTGGGNIVVRRLSGTLNPDSTTGTKELNVAIEEAEEIAINVDSIFGDVADALEDARLNDVVMALTVRNSLGTKLTLKNFRIGVVELTPAGAVPRDGSGNPIFQLDSLNNPIQVAIVDTGQATLTVAARTGPAPTVKTVGFQVAPLVDRALDLLLQNKRAGLVATGVTTAGDAAVKSTVSRTDSVSLTLATTVALDITVPPSGVTFGETRVQEGADLDSLDANQIADRVESATARSIVVNQTPFGVQVRIALVPDSQPASVDADAIFLMPNRVELGPVDLSPAGVNPQGQVTTPVTDTVSVSMTGTQSRVLFGQKFTAALRVTLLPNPGANGRGALRPTDRVIVNAGASVTIRIGGGS